MGDTRVTLKNIKSLQLMQTNENISTGVAIDPILTGGMCVGGNAIIRGGLSVTGLGHFTGGVSISGGASIGPFFIGDDVNLTNNGVLVLNGATGVIGTSPYPAGGSGGGTTSPSGSITQIQYNDGGGNFGADASFTWSGAGGTGTSVLGVSGSISVLGGPITLDTSAGLSLVSIQGNQNLNGEIILYNAVGTSINITTSSTGLSTFKITLPETPGNSGQVLSTDGAGILTFIDQTSGGGGVTTLGGLSDAYTDASNITLGVSPTNIQDNTFNTAVGISALFDITSGTNNTVMGYNAGVSLTTGAYHVAIGVDALKTESTGIGSVAVGYNTLSQQTNNSLTNIYNTAVGWGAGSGLTSGTSCTFIGASTGITAGISGHNVTCLGFGAQPSHAGVSNEVTLGNNQIETLRCAEATIASLSDARDKNDIRDSTYGLNFLENIRPVEFTWDRRVLTAADEDDPKQGKRRVGFIAQELQEAMPDGENDILDLVYTSNPQRLEAKYGNLIPVMVKAIQDLKQEVDTIKEHLNLE
jgi:trimeric autotransporter adhesin